MTTLPGDVDRGTEDNALRLPLSGYERMTDGRLRCKFCDYTCKDIRRLEEHMRTHTGEKPFRCHLCPFASAYVRHLEAHTHSHTGEKPYKCNLCSFRCGDRSNLSHHRRRRHEASGSAPWGLRGGGRARPAPGLSGLGPALVHSSHHHHHQGTAATSPPPPPHSPQVAFCRRFTTAHGGGQWTGTKCSTGLLNVASTSYTSHTVGTMGSADLTPALRYEHLISDGGADAADVREGRLLGQPSLSVGHTSGVRLGMDSRSRSVRMEECSQKVICWKSGRMIIDEVGYEKDYGVIHSDTAEHIQKCTASDLPPQDRTKTQRHAHDREAPPQSPVIAFTYSLTQHSPDQSHPETPPQQQTPHGEPRSHSQACSPPTTSSYACKREPAKTGGDCQISSHKPSSNREIIRRGDNRLRSRSSSSSSSSSAVILPVAQVSSSVPPNSHSSLRIAGPRTGPRADGHTCPHCGIWFPDNVLYTIHMGCHDHDNPFWCNLCGHQCHDRYDFNCHFALGQHSE